MTKALLSGTIMSLQIKKKGSTMKNDITELIFILDRYGSMAGLEGDTVGGEVQHI